MDFHYVFLYEVCWLALIKCFSSENNVKKKFVLVWAWNCEKAHSVLKMLYFIIQMLEGLDPSGF